MLGKKIILGSVFLLVISFMSGFSLAVDNDVFNYYGIKLGSTVNEAEKIVLGQGFSMVNKGNLYVGAKEGVADAKVYLNFDDSTKKLTNVTIEFKPTTPEEKKTVDTIYKKFLSQAIKTYGKPSEESGSFIEWNLEDHRKVSLYKNAENGLINISHIYKSWELM